MARNKHIDHLHRLSTYEFAPDASDELVISGYQSLIGLLKTQQIDKLIVGSHELLFRCISRIALNPCHRCFTDDQLKLLFDIASNSRLLTMSQNQVIDCWYQNIEERTFEGPDENDNSDDNEQDVAGKEDDENWSDTSTASDEHDKLGRYPKFKRQKSRTSILALPTHIHMRKSDLLNFSERMPTQNKPSVKKNVGQDSQHFIGRIPPKADNGERNTHSKYDETKFGQTGNLKTHRFEEKTKTSLSSSNTSSLINSPNPVNFYKKQKNNLPKDDKKSVSLKMNPCQSTFDSESQLKLQQVFNHVSTLLNCGQTVEDRNNSFVAFCTIVTELMEHNADELTRRFRDKEASMYGFVSHVAQNKILFDDHQYQQLLKLKKTILNNKYRELDNNRLIFCRRRHLVPLSSITESLKSGAQMVMQLFNDLQEYLMRSQYPIDSRLYDLIRNLLKSTIYVDTVCFENFTKEILSGSKKNIFTELQLEELRACLEIREKRNQRAKQKRIWKERLSLLRQEKLPDFLDLWLSDLAIIISAELSEGTVLTSTNLDHAMWYFAILTMINCGHLNSGQFHELLRDAIQSPLFNQIQKFYFKYYIDLGGPLITFIELSKIERIIKQGNTNDRKQAVERLVSIVKLQKPDFKSVKISEEQQVLSKSQSHEDLIPLVDEYLVQRFVSIIQIICWDRTNFKNGEGRMLVEQMVQSRSIFHPLYKSELKQLQQLETNVLTLSELKRCLSSLSFDLVHLIKQLKERTLESSDDCLDFLTVSLLAIFEDRQRFRDEQCQQLKGLIEKHVYGKQRWNLIHSAYVKHRSIKETIELTPKLLNEYLKKILEYNQEATLEFLNILENYSKTASITNATIDWEINRCLLSSLILIIAGANETNFGEIHQRLKTLMKGDSKEFFSSILRCEQLQMVRNCLKLSSDNLESLIETVKTNFNEETYQNLVSFIENRLKDPEEFNRLVCLILFSFDNQCLPEKNVFHLVRLIRDHSNLKSKSIKLQMTFLSDLLTKNIYASPSCLHRWMQSNTTNKKALSQMISMLQIPSGQFASNEWKHSMVKLLGSLRKKNENQLHIRKIIEQSTMFREKEWRNQLTSPMPDVEQKQFNERKPRGDDSQPTRPLSYSKTRNGKTANDSSEAHRKMFQYLFSNDENEKLLVINQLQQSLVEEKLPPLILLPKFIQALEIVIKLPAKQNPISLNQWTQLIAKNRGKIFTADSECDDILFLITLNRIKIEISSLTILFNMIESTNEKEKQKSFQIFTRLLNLTKVNDKAENQLHLPTISVKMYDLLRKFICIESFNTNQIKKLLQSAQDSWLFVHEQREEMRKIQKK